VCREEETTDHIVTRNHFDEVTNCCRSNLGRRSPMVHLNIIYNFSASKSKFEDHILAAVLGGYGVHTFYW
jgi:hypothetical protein